MKDNEKTKEQLIKELVQLRQRIAELEILGAERKKAEKKLKEAYKELKETQAQLIHSEKMASIGQLAAGAAHEINNPLTAIIVEMQTLLEDKDKDTKDAARTILEQSKRINLIVGRLLEFSRKREVKFEPFDINNAVEKSVSLLTYQAKIENIEIVKELNPDLPKVLGDLDQIQEVFLNIMLNATQSMEEEGKLTIGTRMEEVIKYGRRETDVFNLGQEVVVIEFKDTGRGMDEETLAKIFDPFFSTKKKGTGLGLSICYGIIRNHNGTIEARSQIGKGSTFLVELPIERGKK